MAGYGAFQFASPSEYGDWAQYAGLNRRTGEVDVAPVLAGVKPPENMQQYMDQRMAGAEGKLAAIVPAVQQAAQGNMFQAAQTMRQAQPKTAPQAPQAPQSPAVDTGYDYTFGL